MLHGHGYSMYVTCSGSCFVWVATQVRQTDGVAAYLVTTATIPTTKATTVRATPVALTVSASLSAGAQCQGQHGSLMAS